MAQYTTENLYTGDGKTKLYSFTFPYIDSRDVRVRLDGKDLVRNKYTIESETQLVFDEAPGNGVSIRIYRETDAATTPNTFYPGSTIRAKDLNDNFTQALYVSQEATYTKNQAEEATDIAEEALRKAENAVTTADDAKVQATVAKNTANSASSTANSALTIASDQKSDIKTAQTTANQAFTRANEAFVFGASALARTGGTMTGPIVFASGQTFPGSGGGGGTAGVTSIIAGDGISVNQATGDVTVTATGSGVGFSGDYNDLTNKPTIPAEANDATITLKQGTDTIGTFSVNQANDKILTIPASSGGDGSSHIISILDYGADPTGAVDSTEAIQNAFDAAAGGEVHIPEGLYLLEGSEAEALNSADYDYNIFKTGEDLAGQTIKACLTLPYGTKISTAGYGSQLWFKDLGPEVCGIAIGKKSTTHSQTSHSIIEALTLRVSGSDGLYGIVTPKGPGIFSNQRPWYEMALNLIGDPANDTLTILANQWRSGVMIGDAMGGTVDVRGYGTYDPTIADAGQRNQAAVATEGSLPAGTVQLKVRINVSTFRTGFRGGDGLEGCAIVDSEMQGVYFGIVIASGSGEPGGYISNCHINCNKTGIYLANKVSCQITSCEVYRSDGYYDAQDGSTWYGIHIAGTNTFPCRYITISSCNILPGSLHDKTNTSGVFIEKSHGVQVSAYAMTQLENAFRVLDSEDCSFGLGYLNGVTNVFSLEGAATKDLVSLQPTFATDNTVFYVTSDGFNSPLTLDFPGNDTPAPVGDSFPAGTRMLFQQASPPTGWSVSNSYDNRALRISTDGGGGDSGSSFTATFAPRNVPIVTTVNGGIASHTLSINEIPNHSHSANYRLGTPDPGSNGNVGSGTNFKGNLSGNTGSTGGNSGHSHGHSISVTASGSVDMSVKYANVCIGIKN